MRLRGRPTQRADSGRVKAAIASAGLASFALLYATQPVLPQLGAEFQLGPGGASLAVSVATGALAVAVLPIAVWSEIVGRRPVILASVIGAVLLGLLLPLAPNYPVLLGLRGLQGIAIAGFPGVAAAYLVEQLGRGGVAAAVGAMIAGNAVGGMAGRLASGVTATWFGWRGALAVVAGVAMVFGLFTILALPARPDGGLRNIPRSRQVVAGLGAAVRKPVLLAQYAVALLAVGSFVALYNAAVFRLTGKPIDLPPAVASLVFLAYATGTVSSVMAGTLVGRFGRSRTLVGALVVMMAGAAATLSDRLPLVVLGFAVLTGAFFAVHTVANGWVAAEAPETARGQASGLYTLSFYIGSSVGGSLGAIIYGRAGWTWLIGFTALSLTVAVAVVLISRVLSAAAQREERLAAREVGESPVPSSR